MSLVRFVIGASRVAVPVGVVMCRSCFTCVAVTTCLRTVATWLMTSQVAVPVGVALLALQAGNTTAAGWSLVIAAFLAVSFYLGRAALAMVASLLGGKRAAVTTMPWGQSF
jgi:hypothetical protein